MNYLLKNWQTTSAGLTMIIGSVVHLIFTAKANTATEMVWTVSLTAIVGGFGLIFAGDAKASAKAQEEAKTMIAAVSERVQDNTDAIDQNSQPTHNQNKV